MSFLLDPRLFNIAIIVMFVFAAIRWWVAGNYAQSGYWAAAACLNVCVTMMGEK